MKRTKKSWRVAVACGIAGLVFLCAGMASAQTGTGAFFGQVVDSRNAPVVNAQVTVTQAEIGLVRAAQTDVTGSYRLAALPPGSYSVTVSKDGFRSEQRPAVELSSDAALPLNFTLQAGSSKPAGNVQPTPEPASFSAQPSTPPQSFNRSSSHTDPDKHVATQDDTAVVRTLEWLQELHSGPAAPAAGGSSHTRPSPAGSGTNQVHGSLNWSHRNTAWSANEFFNKLSQVTNGMPNRPPKLQQHDFSGAVGGPIIKDRLFLFADVDNFRASTQSPVARTVPSDSLRDGVLIYRCATPADCPATSVRGFGKQHAVPDGYYGLTPTQLAGLDPLGIGPNRDLMAYYNQYPHPNDPGRDIYNIAGYRFAAPILAINWTELARVDYNLTQNGKHRLFWRGNLQHDIAPQQFLGGIPNSSTVNNSKGYVVGYDAVLSRTLVSAFRYGYTRAGYATSGNLNANYAAIQFIDPFEGNHAPTSTRNIPTHNFVEDITWMHGRHTWQFGGNVRIARINGTNNGNSFISATANGSWLDGDGNDYAPGTSCLAPSTANCLALPAVAGNFGYGDDWVAVLGVLL